MIRTVLLTTVAAVMMAGPVLAHRLLPTAEAQVSGRTPADVVADLVARLALPTAAPSSRRGR